jgi:tryptophan-rich sensory protein
MDWPALYKTLGLCLVSILIEVASYTKSGKIWFEHLRQPRYSISLKVWYFVGAIYYILFGIIAYRQFRDYGSIISSSIILLALVMLLNGVGNFIIFKYRSVKWFYLIIYPFGLILLTLIIVLLKRDIISALLASLYFLWLIYDLYYGYQLWKLNRNLPENI